MKIICRDRQKTSAPEGRALSSVAADINRLLSPKTYEQLQALEVQVKRKLNSNEPIDTDYWEELLRSLTVWKARARLRNVYQAVIDERVRDLRKQQKEEAESIKAKLAPLAPVVSEDDQQPESDLDEFKGLDPDPLLQVRPEDKGLEIMDESVFLRQVVSILDQPNSAAHETDTHRAASVKRSFAWDMSLCGSDQLRNQARLPSTQLQAVHLLLLYLVDFPLSPMMTSHKQLKRCMRENWPRVSVRMKRSSPAKRLSVHPRSLNGPASTVHASPATSTASKWGMSGISITRPITTMTTRLPRLCKVTSSTSSTPI